MILFGACQIYVGGCFLGDAIDVEFDQKHKPSRPIPSGILRRSTVYTWAWLLILSGTFSPILLIALHYQMELPLVMVSNLWPILSLPACVILYSIFHKRSALLGLSLIGLCRFTLIAYTATIALWSAPEFAHNSGPTLLYYGIPVAIYTICFASVARTEASPSPVSKRKLLAVTMFLLPLASFVLISMADPLKLATLISLAIYWLWLSSGFRKLNHDKGRYVAKCLAGFSLLDACYASSDDNILWLLVCLGLFTLALLLQRWAPAT